MKTHHNLLIRVLTLVFTLQAAILCADVNASPEQNAYDNEQKGRPQFRAFSIHDLDDDGFLSREEYSRFVVKMENRRKSIESPKRRFLPPLKFEEIDVDNDGRLSEDEMIDALNKRLKKHRAYRYREGKN